MRYWPASDDGSRVQMPALRVQMPALREPARQASAAGPFTGAR